MKISRKKFISQMTQIAGAVALAPSILQAKNEEASQNLKDKTAIVVGAGLAGLTAAYLLKNRGFKVKVLEAGKNPGGRISTWYGHGMHAELGGEWISADHSSIIKLIHELGLLTEEHKYRIDLSLDNELKAYGVWDLSQDYKDLITKLVKLYQNMSSSQREGLDKISFYNYLSYQGVLDRDLKLADLEYGISYGESIRHISAEKLLGDLSRQSIRFGHDMIVKGGNFTLIKTLASRIGRFNFYYSDPVASVRQENNKVTIKTISGKEHESEVCVFTVPPAAMHTIKWSPELPRDKVLSAIQLKYGRVVKNLIIADRIDLIRDDYAIYTDGPVEMAYHATLSQKGKKSVITAVASGDKADMYNRKNSEYNRQLIFTGLNGTAFTSSIGNTEIITANFSSNPFIKGSVSVYSGGSWNAKEILAQTHGRVYFAGEHLAATTGTMNAAVESAIKAVESI